jgi:hypothetical protein
MVGGTVTINELGIVYTLLGEIRARPVKPNASKSRLADEEVDTSLMYRFAPMYPTVQLIAVPALEMAVGWALPTCTGVWSVALAALHAIRSAVAAVEGVDASSLSWTTQVSVPLV